ncbi:MAG: hypothetical protein WBY53_04735 [Acidobacteriaceae bacterium]
MPQSVVLSGHTDVIKLSPLLEALAERWDQAGAMHWLSFFLRASSFQGKKPCLVLILEPGVTATAETASLLRPEQVYAAVLLFEYRVMGLPTGAFCTDDWAGFRTVVGPDAERGAMAAIAADALIATGAQIVLISYLHAVGTESGFVPAMRHASRWAFRSRPVATTLMLEPTVKATLAKLGKSTRFNLGYYRRRLNAAMNCEFVADARGMLIEGELDAVNRGSLNPVRPDEFRLQYESACKLPGGFLLGLRDDRGQWLSLIGGWRQGDVTVLYWQMNASGFEKLSIGTAMRSYFLEHEVQSGARKLVYYGGTPHSMGNSFVPQEATDLIVRRPSIGAFTLRTLARLFVSLRYVTRVNSLLVQSITDSQITWRPVDRRPSQQPQPRRAEL